MNYQKFTLHPLLEPLVEHLILASSKGDIYNPAGFCLPNCSTALTIHLGEPFFLIENGNQIQLPNAFFVGQITRSKTIIPGETFDTVLIQFKPTGLYHLFNIPMLSLCKSVYIDAYQILNNQIDSLIKRLSLSTTPEDRKNIVEFFLLEKTRSCKTSFNFVEECIEIIFKQSGIVSISKMIEGTKVSARTFRDAFIKRVGVSAKVFARIVRINTVLEQFKCAPTRQWQDVVFSSGYYDQAHFIKDFKAMTGKSPTLFSDLNLQYIRMLSGR